MGHRASGKPVRICGSGAALLTACEVALWAEENAGFAVEKHVETGSVQVVDELPPDSKASDSAGDTPVSRAPSYEERTVSSIYITLRSKKPERTGTYS